VSTQSPSRFLVAVLPIVALLGVHCAKESASPSTPVETSGSPATAPAVPAAPATPATAATPSAPTPPATPARPGQKEGDLCGGIAGLQCAEGLTCKMVGKAHPDQAGTCTKP
jgi:hypothetical protein